MNNGCQIIDTSILIGPVVTAVASFNLSIGVDITWPINSVILSIDTNIFSSINACLLDTVEASFVYSVGPCATDTMFFTDNSTSVLNDIATCWYGDSKGKEGLDLGTYYYYLRATTDCGIINKQGDILLLQ